MSDVSRLPQTTILRSLVSRTNVASVGSTFKSTREVVGFFTILNDKGKFDVSSQDFSSGSGHCYNFPTKGLSKRRISFIVSDSEGTYTFRAHHDLTKWQ